MTRNVFIDFLQSYEANPLENNHKVKSNETQRVFSTSCLINSVAKMFSKLQNNSERVGFFFYKIDN